MNVVTPFTLAPDPIKQDQQIKVQVDTAIQNLNNGIQLSRNTDGMDMQVKFPWQDPLDTGVGDPLDNADFSAIREALEEEGKKKKEAANETGETEETKKVEKVKSYGEDPIPISKPEDIKNTIIPKLETWIGDKKGETYNDTTYTEAEITALYEDWYNSYKNDVEANGSSLDRLISSLHDYIFFSAGFNAIFIKDGAVENLIDKTDDALNFIWCARIDGVTLPTYSRNKVTYKVLGTVVEKDLENVTFSNKSTFTISESTSMGLGQALKKNLGVAERGYTENGLDNIGIQNTTHFLNKQSKYSLVLLTRTGARVFEGVKVIKMDNFTVDQEGNDVDRKVDFIFKNFRRVRTITDAAVVSKFE